MYIAKYSKNQLFNSDKHLIQFKLINFGYSSIELFILNLGKRYSYSMKIRFNTIEKEAFKHYDPTFNSNKN